MKARIKRKKTYYAVLAAICTLHFALCVPDAESASVVAIINGTPVTDADIVARTQILPTSTDNRKKALDAIIDDLLKLDYAANFKLSPTDAEIKKHKPRNEAEKLAIAAEMAWQMVVTRTIMPLTDVGNDEIKQEMIVLEKERGLPLELTFIRIVDAPKNIRLEPAISCDAAESQIKKLGGEPQKITALQYELADDVREKLAGQPLNQWIDREYFICFKKKAKEYGRLDEIIKQNAQYRKAMFAADQQLKQLRRRAVIVYN